MEGMSYTERLRLVRLWNQLSGNGQRDRALMSSPKRDVRSERRLSTFLRCGTCSSNRGRVMGKPEVIGSSVGLVPTTPWWPRDRRRIMLFVTANGGGFHGEKQTQKGSEDGPAGLPDDIGGTVASLLADDNLWINRQRIEASGGMLLGNRKSGSGTTRAKSDSRMGSESGRTIGTAANRGASTQARFHRHGQADLL